MVCLRTDMDITARPCLSVQTEIAREKESERHDRIFFFNLLSSGPGEEASSSSPSSFLLLLNRVRALALLVWQGVFFPSVTGWANLSFLTNLQPPLSLSFFLSLSAFLSSSVFRALSSARNLSFRPWWVRCPGIFCWRVRRKGRDSFGPSLSLPPLFFFFLCFFTDISFSFCLSFDSSLAFSTRRRGGPPD